MELTRISDRLKLFPERRIHFYGQSGEVTSKSYPQVRTDVDRFVRTLEEAGGRSGMRVGILAGNSYEWVVADLAIMEIGATSVAFPEEFATTEPGDLLEKFQLALLLFSGRDEWAGRASGEQIGFIDRDNGSSLRVPLHAKHPSADTSVHSLTFSSGTSGKIKCLITNAPGVEETISSFYQLFDIDSSDSFLIFLPLSSLQQRLMVYAAFYYGFDQILVKPTDVFKSFKDFRPTLCLAPPLLYETVHAQFEKTVRGLAATRRLAFRVFDRLARLESPARFQDFMLRLCYGKIHEALGGRMRIMWTGMAPIKRVTLDFFARARLPLYEAYGLTECGPIATNTPAQNRLGSVGRPITGGSVTLAQDGEVIVRKRNQLTLGYLNAAEDQAATYLDSNTVATGDIGYLDDEGFLYITGRKKEIIVTPQGHKVHPEVFEARLDRFPEADRSVVLAVEGSLVALVSTQARRRQAFEQSLRKYIDGLNRESKNGVRIDGLVVTDVQFTRENRLMTRNLKLDRRALFRHFKEQLVTAIDPKTKTGGVSLVPAESVASSELERAIIGIWRDVLMVDQVGPQDDFFSLGGNSLLLAQVRTRLQEDLQLEISAVDMFTNPTVTELTKYFVSQQQPASVPVDNDALHERVRRQKDALRRQQQIGLARRHHG